MRKKTNLFLFVFLAFLTLWFLGQALIELQSYLRLSQKTQAHIDRWEIVETKGGKYSIQAVYHYEIQGKEYINENSFQKHPFLNKYSAKETLQDFAKKTWEAWYDPNDPGFSQLFKEFPVKSGVRGLIVLGIFLYFVFLYGRMKKKFVF
ncbi:MAG: DUF3592 domain-containing protein [Chlamydiota bacterium]